MTNRPEPPPAGVGGPPPGRDERLREEPASIEDLDHKRIGRVYIVVGFAFLVIGGLAGMLMRGELAEPGAGFIAEQYGRIFSLHVTVLAVLALPAIWTGLATHLVPLQIGANRVAFPRLHAASLWVHVAGGALILAAYSMDGLAVVGTSFAAAVNLSGAASTADELWVTGAGLVALGALAATISIFTTLVTLRAPAVRLLNLPLFSWAVLATAAVSLISIPVHLAGLTILYVDRHFGGELFAGPGGDELWRHTLWLFGRPEIFLMVLPGLGVAAAVAAGHARRPLLGERGIRGALVAAAVLSVGAWAAGPSAANALTVPTFSLPTAVVGLVLLSMVPAWAGTLALGRPRFHPALGFVFGAVAIGGLAALNAVVAAVVGVTGGAWSTAYLHSGFFLPAVLLASAALWHWAPKLWGRRLSAASGWIAALLVTGGSVVQAGAGFLAGYQGAPNRSIEAGSVALNRIGGLGAAVALLGLAIVVFEVTRAVAGGPERALADDPWGESEGLEWTIASPPARRNFDSLPGSDPVVTDDTTGSAGSDDAEGEDAQLAAVGAAT